MLLFTVFIIRSTLDDAGSSREVSEQPGVAATQGFAPAACQHLTVRDDHTVEVPLQDPIQTGARRAPVADQQPLQYRGEYEDTVDAQAGLLPGVTPTVAIILVIIVGLFNAFRPPIVILLIIPFVWIGITFGLLVFNVPFGFVALLGAMSLVGMMIKNAIVLLDQVNLNLAEGMAQYEEATL